MKQGGGKASVNEEEVSLAVGVPAPLITVVNEFLADPVKNVSPKKDRTIIANGIDKEMDEKGHKNATEEIKNRHREKERLLVSIHNNLNGVS